MATSAKSEQPESGDQEVLEFADERPQGPEGFQGTQEGFSRTTKPPNKLDEVAGGDAKRKAQLALSSDGPYGDEVGKEGNGPGKAT